MQHVTHSYLQRSLPCQCHDVTQPLSAPFIALMNMLIVREQVWSWAAQYNFWLLIKLTPKGVVFPFHFFSFFFNAGLEDTPGCVAYHTTSGHAVVLSTSPSGASWLRLVHATTLTQVTHSPCHLHVVHVAAVVILAMQ